MTTTIGPRLPRGDMPAGGIVPALPFRVPAAAQRIALEAAEAARERRSRGEPIGGDVTNGAEVSEEVKRQQAEVRRAALLNLLPPKRENCRQGLACLDEDQHPLELQAWLDDPHARTLILVGRPGNGKTQAAYATAAHSARFGAMMWNSKTGSGERRPLIVRGWTVNNYHRELMPDGSPEPVWSVRHRAIWAELLILDDLGAELDDTASQFMRKELADLLDARLERNLRTIFTTNHESAVVEKRLGDRMWSRLQEDSTSLVFTGPDRRAMRTLSW